MIPASIADGAIDGAPDCTGVAFAEPVNDAFVNVEEGLTDRATDACEGAGDGTGVAFADSNFSRFALVSADEEAGDDFAEARDALDNAGDGLTGGAASCLIDLASDAWDGAGDGIGVASFASDAREGIGDGFGVAFLTNAT